MSEKHDPHLCEACRNDEYEDFRHTCVHESMEKSNLWLAKYKIGTWPRWDYSMDNGTLIFSERGKAKVICEMQVVGSAQGESWEWSWGNKNYPDVCKSMMVTVRDLGIAKSWNKLATLFLTNDEYLGWECASIANHVLSGMGA